VADVDAALAAAESAAEEWRSLSYIDRAEFLWDIYHELRDRHDELGKIVSKECGKEISEGKADVTEAWHMVEWAAGNARHPHGDVVPSEIGSKDAYMRRKPRGVVGCITPWNFPVAIPFWHMAIALVEGNTVVWKPAEQTPWCGQIIAEMFEESGIPDGVFNMVQGFGDAGAAIADDERVDTVLFTGSAEVGHEIAGNVGGEPGKLAACEMGGKNGIVITEEADLDIAVHAAIMSSFKTTGQRCVSSERLIVHEDVYDEFKARFVDIAEDIAVGDPLEADTFMGPAIEADHVEKIRRHNDLARDEGATVLVDRFELADEEIPDGSEDGAATAADGERSAATRTATGRPVRLRDRLRVRPALSERGVFRPARRPHRVLGRYRGRRRDSQRHPLRTGGRDHLGGLPPTQLLPRPRRNRARVRESAVYRRRGPASLRRRQKSGNGYPSAREAIEAVTERTAWTMNNSREIEMAQGLSADIKTTED